VLLVQVVVDPPFLSVLANVAAAADLQVVLLRVADRRQWIHRRKAFKGQSDPLLRRELRAIRIVKFQ
jgi:hypothetical protein